MAGIYIPGMGMPAGCPVCFFSHWTASRMFPGCNAVPGKSYAVVDDLEYRESPADSRPEWCPLVSVPDHGRLINADALEVIGYCGIPQGREGTFDSGVMWLAEQIDLLPTIIPADPAEEGHKGEKSS